MTTNAFLTNITPINIGGEELCVCDLIGQEMKILGKQTFYTLSCIRERL